MAKHLSNALLNFLLFSVHLLLFLLVLDQTLEMYNQEQVWVMVSRVGILILVSGGSCGEINSLYKFVYCLFICLTQTTIIWDAHTGEAKQQFPFHSGKC